MDQLISTILSTSAAIMAIFLGILGIVLSHYSSYDIPGAPFKKKMKRLSTTLLILIFFNFATTVLSFFSYTNPCLLAAVKIAFIILLALIPMAASILVYTFFRR